MKNEKNLNPKEKNLEDKTKNKGGKKKIKMKYKKKILICLLFVEVMIHQMLNALCLFQFEFLHKTKALKGSKYLTQVIM